jgi:hypothetical protein
VRVQKVALSAQRAGVVCSGAGRKLAHELELYRQVVRHDALDYTKSKVVVEPDQTLKGLAALTRVKPFV